MSMPRITVWLVLALGWAAPAGAQDTVPLTPSPDGGRVESELPPAPAFDFAPAAKPDPDDVHEALSGLLDRGRDRLFFGLPEAATWRVAGPVRVALYSDRRGEFGPALKSAAQAFARVTTLPIELAAARPLSAVAGADAVRWATGANLEVLIGPRPVMAQFAGAIPVNQWMLERFEDGRWPFTFSFPRDDLLIGRVMMADDEPPEALEAGLILALVWALGGVTLGDELKDLVDPDSPQPALTPLGQEVFALMYHPEMEAGLPLADALKRARRLLDR
jgi:hypothetical protein